MMSCPDWMKVLLTEAALVRPLTGVDSHVPVQFAGMFKCPVTDGAGVGPLLLVDPQVDRQVLLDGEALVTHGA